MTGRTSPREVFEEIERRRRDTATRPDAGRTQGTRLGLVVEGGAMRGAVSMAYLAALERSRATSVFDSAFAESSGAVNAAYFVSGQAEAGLDLYREAVRSRFVRKWRISGMLDLDSVFKPVMSGKLSLDCDRLRRSPTTVQVSLTDSASGSPVSLPLQGSNDRIYTILKATTAIVPYYNRAVLLDGRRYVDGGVADPIPVLRAIEAGCAHILVLLTRTGNYRPRRLRLWERVATNLLVRSWSSGFRNVFHHSREPRYYRSRALALGLEVPAREVSIAAIAPPASLGRIERFFHESDRLQAVVDTCAAQMESILASWAELAR
jgi:predicted patatin/cPLA2 family phospholipase